MKKIRWQLVIILLTGMVVGALLLTQGPGGTQPSSTTTPTSGGVYAEGLVGSLKRLNPLLDLYNQPDRDIDRLIYSGLVKFDSKGYPQPDLAETWGTSQDGLTYNFSLKEGLVWHDGKPITADDVIFTIELMRAGDPFVPSDVRDFWNNITVVKGDERTLQFQLPEAYSPFLDYLTFGILPEHLLKNVGPEGLVDAAFNLNPVGSGPYRFDHLIMDGDQIQGVVLSLFDDYVGQKPYIEQVLFRYYPDGESALQAYQSGEIQGLGQVATADLPGVLNEPNLSVYTARLPELSLVMFNLKNQDVAFFQDDAVRQALMKGLNRQWISDHILNGQAIVADGPLFPGTWAYADNLTRISADSDAAAAMLKDAGYVIPAEGDPIRAKDGVQLSFTMVYPDDEIFGAIAERIQQDWQAIGVQVGLEALPYEQLVSERLNERDYQAALVHLNLSRSPDPDPYPFWDMAQATGGQNYSQWDDRNASEYLEQARITQDNTERLRFYHNFQAIFMKEMPALPLYYPVYNYAIDRQIQGVQVGPLFDPSDRFNTLPEWFLVAKQAAESTAAATAQP
ncbi:MAG TPA: peptide ABC transporter substrate-binding protein [Anaerolineaceae bacterium]|nr:peptide ABC transporter substrate-binding protein [Anaerolineaceae bacterium]